MFLSTLSYSETQSLKRSIRYLNIDPNKGDGIDKIHGRLLKDGAELLTESVCKIIILSLSCKFPLICKTAKVKPFYKNGKNNEL